MVSSGGLFIDLGCSIACSTSLSLSLSLSLSQGFMLNFCAVLLELCKPFFANHPSGEKLGLISREYPTSSFCRLDFNNETCFAEGIINSKHALTIYMHVI